MRLIHFWTFTQCTRKFVRSSRVKYHNEAKGFNSRLDELQAAFLREKLALLDGWNTRRGRLAAQYLEQLNGEDLTLPYVPQWRNPSGIC